MVIYTGLMVEQVDGDMYYAMSVVYSRLLVLYLLPSMPNYNNNIYQEAQIVRRL